jgi:leucyl-tRNA synthetase
LEKSAEEKWQSAWDKEHIFEGNPIEGKEKIFVTVPFPYMNGPLHIGHAFTACRVDVYARFKRMQGYATLFPWSWHWTGQPIVAAAERLSNGDPLMLKEFVEIDGVPKEEISKFYNPEYMAKYYTESGRTALKRLGLSIDWRREFHTTSLEPTFNQFVLWQLNKLEERGYITRGTHPVVWCPRDQSPTGDHDRLEGEGVTWEEFTLIFFPFPKESEFSGANLATATLRPETIFAVTNLWVNPNANYVEVVINEKERWIVSERSSVKLRDQQDKVEIARKLSGRDLVGKKVRHPIDSSRTLLILPADFVDPNNGSGVVYSVPAHAPMDYVALRDLEEDTELQKHFGISLDEIKEIKPISLISLPEMGQFPAIELVDKMKITNQKDLRIEIATKEIYKKEFHQGVLNKNAGEFQGRNVQDAKPLIVGYLEERSLSNSFFELPSRVVCRCMTDCTVKVLKDQWFLKYSDPKWKETAHKCIDKAAVYPDSARQWFHDVIDWLKDWPCARKVGLGTPLPWSPGWIVETLSDSTIYMSFYTINWAIKKYSIGETQLTKEFFDFVFLGEGTPEDLSSKVNIPSARLKEMRNEFLFWYPINLRNSAKELIPNHLTFFVFQHVAFFPEDKWPTTISANGMMMNEGVKMSKSKGNVITIAHALDSYGADTLRAALVGGAEGMDDIDWREKNVKDIESKINQIPSFIQMAAKMATGSSRYGEAELLLESRIQGHISKVVGFLDQMKTKSAFQDAFYGLWGDIRYYLKRAIAPSNELMQYALDTWIRLLAPFIPYTCEETYSLSGHTALVSVSEYPIADSSKLHPEAEISELAVQRLISDTQNIMKLLPKGPSTIHVYLPPEWSYRLLFLAIESRNQGKDIGQVLQQFFLSDPDVPKKDAASMLPKIMKTLNEIGDTFAKMYAGVGAGFDEDKSYSKALDYIEQELGAKVKVHSDKDSEKYDPKQKAKFALPFKPALYLE